MMVDFRYVANKYPPLTRLNNILSLDQELHKLGLNFIRDYRLKKKKKKTRKKTQGLETKFQNPTEAKKKSEVNQRLA